VVGWREQTRQRTWHWRIGFPETERSIVNKISDADSQRLFRSMSFSDQLRNVAVRGFLIATLFGPTFVTGDAAAQEPHQKATTSKEQPTQPQEIPADKAEIPPMAKQSDAPVPPKSQEGATVYRSSCGETADDKQADLCEQIRQADAAVLNAKWAFWQLVANAAGLAILIPTLIFTALSAIAARRSADAAEQAITHLERPFVYVEVRSRGCYTSGEGYLVPDGDLIFECINLGRTPADLLDLRDDIVEVGLNDWPEPIVPTNNPRTLPPGTVAAPGGIPHQFSINLAQRIGPKTTGKNGIDTNLFLIGYIRYGDVFGKRYVTGFCAMHDPVSWNYVLRGDDRYNYTRQET
jgi:hypothetical protein